VETTINRKVDAKTRRELKMLWRSSNEPQEGWWGLVLHCNQEDVQVTQHLHEHSLSPDCIEHRKKSKDILAIRDKHEPINLTAWVTYCRDLSHQRRTAWLLSYGVNCTMKMEWKMRKYRFEAKKLLVGQGYHLWQDKTHVRCAFTTFQQILT
jgi:hypothetical protein